MAHIFIGDRSRVDEEVLEAAKGLSDDFWVFAEFNMGRNVDWLIIRPRDIGPATVILTELKRVPRPLFGNENGHWEEEVGPDQRQMIRPSNADDVNYFNQAVNAANEMQRWLWNNQPVYKPGGEPLRESEVKVWPDLLILSPPGVRHFLPLKPANGYGMWFYSTERWIWHIENWKPGVGMPLQPDEVQEIARIIGLREVEPDPVAPLSIEELTNAMKQLERRVETLERQKSVGAPAIAPANGAAEREFTPELAATIRDAVNNVRRTGRSRATPSILSAMQSMLGYDLKQTSYNGFGNATAFFEAAKAKGIIKFGPNLGPNPTIFLTDEETDLN